MFIIRYKNFFLILTAVIVVAALASIARFGISYGIDFTGGSILELSYSAGRPPVGNLQTKLAATGLGTATIQPIGENGVLVRLRSISEAERQKLLGALGGESRRFDSIGPVIGQELKNRALWSIVLVILLIVLYITFAFRKVSQSVSSWKYGLIAIVALLHDVIVPTGIYVVYGHYTGAEVDVLFVTALLAILGFSVHDTIVVFDRIRENLKLAPKDETFEHTIGKSLSQTFTRSINTSLTVVLVLLVLLFLGGSSTVHFAFLLTVGIIAGTYSSIFLASPLLVVVEHLRGRK